MQVPKVIRAEASSLGHLVIYVGIDGGSGMSSQESEQMLALLKELSLLKVLDAEYAGSPKTDLERDAHRQRQQRHREIAEEIKALAAQKQEAEQNPAA